MPGNRHLLSRHRAPALVDRTQEVGGSSPPSSILETPVLEPNPGSQASRAWRGPSSPCEPMHDRPASWSCRHRRPSLLAQLQTVSGGRLHALGCPGALSSIASSVAGGLAARPSRRRRRVSARASAGRSYAAAAPRGLDRRASRGVRWPRADRQGLDREQVAVLGGLGAVSSYKVLKGSPAGSATAP
jgi:hypothetical protein